MKRRSFLASMLAASVAPAFVKAGVLMPVKQIVVPEPGTYDDILNDDIKHLYPDSEYYRAELGVIMGMMIKETAQRKGFTRHFLERQLKSTLVKPYDAPLFVHSESWRDLAKQYG